MLLGNFFLELKTKKYLQLGKCSQVTQALVEMSWTIMLPLGF